MPPAELGSRSDLEALRRSGRGKLVILGLMLTAAAGGALYSFARPTGTGNPEEETRVLLVTRGQTVGQSIALRDLGFDSIEGTLAAWERKAAEEVPDLDETGVGAVMALADRFGYGFVVFEAPRNVDFSGIEIEGGLPTFPDHVQYAALSAGDFAFPHVMSLNPPPSPVMRDRSVTLLQTLFAQPRLEQLLPENDQPSVEVLERRDQLRLALDRLARVPLAEKLAREVTEQVERLLVSEEGGDPRATVIGEPFESGSAYPLANGTVLHIARGFSVVSGDGVRVDLDLDAEESLWSLAPGEERRPCRELSGGALAASESARWEVALDGSSILFRTLSEGLVLWRVEDGEPGTCGLTRSGPIPGPLPGMAELGVPRGMSVARPGTIDGLGVVTVLTAGSEEREMLGMIEGADVVGVSWIDDRRLIARARPRVPGPDALVLLDRDRPLDVLEFKATAFDSAARIRDVAVVPTDPESFAVVVAVDSVGRRLYLLRTDRSLSSLFSEPPVLEGPPAEEAEPVDGQPRVRILDSNAFLVRPLTHMGMAFDPAVSPDGRRVVFALAAPDLDRGDANGDTELALASLDGDTPGIKLLTRNAVMDRNPRFSRDGTEVVFRSRFELPHTNWVTNVARRVTLPEQDER